MPRSLTEILLLKPARPRQLSLRRPSFVTIGSSFGVAIESLRETPMHRGRVRRVVEARSGATIAESARELLGPACSH